MGRQPSSCSDNEEQLRLAYSIFSSRLQDDLQPASLTCSHHVPQASLTITQVYSFSSSPFDFVDYATIQFDRQQQAQDKDVLSITDLTLHSLAWVGAVGFVNNDMLLPSALYLGGRIGICTTLQLEDSNFRRTIKSN
jgi:hypothetical protein